MVYGRGGVGGGGVVQRVSGFAAASQQVSGVRFHTCGAWMGRVGFLLPEGLLELGSAGGDGYLGAVEEFCGVGFVDGAEGLAVGDAGYEGVDLEGRGEVGE